MKEFVPPNRNSPIRIRREDVERLPLMSRDEMRPWAPKDGREWILVVLEEGEEFEAWQVGRLVWIEAPQGCGMPPSGDVVALPAQQARIAERTYLWLQAVGTGSPTPVWRIGQ